MLKNWSQTVAYRSSSVRRPTSVEEIREIVGDPAIASVKVFGTRHCFNQIADTQDGGIHLCLDAFKTITCDGEEVHFGAGVTYSELIEAVDRAGMAVENLPSLPHINVVGSMITCTHGSGADHRILASNVTRFEVVLPDGTLQSMVKGGGPSRFYSRLLSFGALGVITSMSLRVVRPFRVHKAIYERMEWDTMFDDANFDPIMRAGEFVSFFCDWRERVMSTVWIGRKHSGGGERPTRPDRFYGAPHIAEQSVHPVPGNRPSACVTVGDGTWKNKVYHFLPDQPPSADGDEIQTEFFVRYQDFREAMDALYAGRDRFQHLVQITEIRMVAGDDIPMSPAKGSDVVAIHWTWHRRLDEVLAVLPLIESILNPFDAKPHFGKLFVLDGKRMAALYGDDLVTLRGLIERHDPAGKFSNAFVQRYVFSAAGQS